MLNEPKINPEVYELHLLMLNHIISNILSLTEFISEINLRS
jgi:hypothetical protein